jgi:Uma2 family endonuclease
MTAKSLASLVEQLAAVAENGKAEIINGEIVRMSPTGGRPARASGRVYAGLLQHEESRGGGYAVPDNAGFIVDLPNRGSFSPDAAWYVGATVDMGFIEGAPAFAVEVRSENDYGPAAEREIRAKIADYFAAGTLIVWDVDLLSEDVVRKYVATAPNQPATFRRGDVADAEPAVPGWRFTVDSLLR